MMNKQSIGKLNMFFMGITQRNLDNRDFIELEVIFKSGRKEFKGIAMRKIININLILKENQIYIRLMSCLRIFLKRQKIMMD
ncbi:MAG: hypothetical protein ACLRPW_06895 [Intestinibacter sp.]